MLCNSLVNSLCLYLQVVRVGQSQPQRFEQSQVNRGLTIIGALIVMQFELASLCDCLIAEVRIMLVSLPDETESK